MSTIQGFTEIGDDQDRTLKPGRAAEDPGGSNVYVYSEPGFVRAEHLTTGNGEEVQVVLSPLSGEGGENIIPSMDNDNLSCVLQETVETGAEPEAGMAASNEEELDEILCSIKDGANNGPVGNLHGEAEKHYSLGLAYFDEGLMDEALLEFSIAARCPDRASACAIRIARCYVAKNDFQKALDSLQAALELDNLTGDDEITVRYEMARIHESLKDGRSTARELERIRSLDPEVDATTTADRTESHKLFEAPARKLPITVFIMLVGAVLYRGWQLRGEKFLSAETGMGYNLGIAGGVLMLLLLLYPLRKKARFMKKLGPIRYWFKGHMILGIIGPAFILFHANFNTGSFNSTVALIFTLIVALSGIANIYIYSKIHLGLFGSRVTLQDLQHKTEAGRSGLGPLITYAPALKKRLTAFENKATNEPRGIIHSIVRILTIGVRTRWNHFVLLLGVRRALKVTARREGWPRAEIEWQGREARRILSAHMAAVRKVAEFSFYDRLFSLWYFFHLPLFYILVIVVLVHVVAVHMY